MKFMTTLVATGVTLLTLDIIWLTVMAPTYRRLFGDLLLDQFRVAPAGAFYVLYLFGVMILIALPALETGQSLASVAYRGAVLGLVAYGTYSLTNHATLKGYGLQLAVMDFFWGPVLTAASALAGVAAARYLTATN